MILIFEPFIGVGIFQLGQRIERYLDDFEFEYHPHENDYDHYFCSNLGLTLFVDHDVVAIISCERECIYKGRNMLGMSIEEFMSFYDVIPSIDVDTIDLDFEDYPQDVYEFDTLDLQVWVHDGIIVAAML